MKLVTKTSPNRSSRIHGQAAVTLIVVHTPEGSYASAIATCMDDTRPANERVSYHRLYAKDGKEATQLVPFTEKAWHAGPVNSLSEGLAIEGYARHFDLADPGTLDLAAGVAERLKARGLKPQWTTDGGKGGFCRHGDLQANRTDPTPDLAEWRLFVGMVQEAHRKLMAPTAEWPRPIPRWFWAWNLWRLKGRKGRRPASAPKLIPPWAWRRARAFDQARRK